MTFDMPKEKASIIKVVGVGGGGSNAVNYMFNQGIQGVNFVVCNTDAQALELSPVPNKVQIGPDLTEGRGAGSVPMVGSKAMEESLDDIRDILAVNTKMVFITAGMGGGTGTGGAPILARMCREMGILTVGIVTIPFSWEGRRRYEQALEGLEEMRGNVDTIIVISNEKLRQMYGNLKLSQAFANADSVLATAARGIAEIITVPGYVNVDFEDVKTVMKDSGVAIMGIGIAEGQHRAMQAVEEALKSPLLNDSDIEGAKHILLNISSGTEEITMDEVTAITDYVQDQAGNTTDIIWGNCTDDSLGDNISVTIIATGFQADQETVRAKKATQKPVVVSLNDDVEDPSPNAPTYEETNKPFSMEPRLVSPEQPAEKTTKAAEEKVEETAEESANEFTFSFDPNQPMERYELEDETTNEPEAEAEEASTETQAEMPVMDTDTDGPTIEMSLHLSDDEEDLPQGGLPLTPKSEPSENAPKADAPRDIPMRDLGPGKLLNGSKMLPAREPITAEQQSERLRKLKSLSVRLNNPDTLRHYEEEPAYIRRRVELDDVPHSSQTDISRMSILDKSDPNSDKSKWEIRNNNSFLHDSVD